MINKLDNILVDTKVGSVYNYNELSLQGLLSKFFEKINESIDASNDAIRRVKLMEEVTLPNFITWAKEEGIPEETRIVIDEMFLDGRLGELINNTLLAEINLKVDGVSQRLDTILAKIEPNGIDDTLAVQLIINNYKNITFPPQKRFKIKSTILIPSGTFVDFNGCIFEPVTGGTFINGFMILINSTDGEDWIERFGGYKNKIENLIISNPNKLPDIKGIFMGGVTAIENLRTEWLNQTVRIVDRFLDGLTMNRVFVVHHTGNLYAISQDNDETFSSKNANGDSWLFSRLQFEGEGGRRAIYLHGNNDTVTIDGCINGVINLQNGSFKLKNLHIEVGQLIINNAKVSLEDSVLYFDSYNSNKPILVNGIDGYSKEFNLRNVFFTYPFWQDTNTMQPGAYYSAISTTGYNGNITLDNVSQGIINSNSTQAISVSGEGGANPVNYDSFSMVPKSVFTMKGLLAPNEVVSKLPSENLNFANVDYKEVLVNWSSDNDTKRGINWKKPSGAYFYKVGLLVDYNRRLGVYSSTEYEVNVDREGERKIVEISIKDVYLKDVANCSLIIYRGLQTGVYNSRAIIPMSEINTRLIDDGRTVNLRPWVDVTGDVLALQPTKKVISYPIDGSCVAYLNNKPLGSWLMGDRVINSIPTVGSPKGWVLDSVGEWVSEGAL